jgi:ribosomal protein S18 acetylase RimI-like enzyme
MAPVDSGLFDRLERFYDALPRPWSRIEGIGALDLFVRTGEGWPYYARPRLGSHTPSAADITEARFRQRELGAPEMFQWVHEITPDLLAVARSAGLDVLLAPLLVLDPAALVPDLPLRDATIRYLDPAAPSFAADMAASRAVNRLGFGAPAYRAPLEKAENTLVIDDAGPAERDAAPPLTSGEVDGVRAMLGSGDYLTAVAESRTEGILATATAQRVGPVAEIAGVATLPSARNRGYASQLTATLTGRLLAQGVDLVALSAGDDDVARLYTRVGFRRVGTACIGAPAAAPL